MNDRMRKGCCRLLTLLLTLVLVIPAYGQETLDALAAAPVVFEINTGAMARGYRTEPYPAQWIVAELRHRGIKRILSSDCHDKSNLLYGFADYKSWIE